MSRVPALAVCILAAAAAAAHLGPHAHPPVAALFSFAVAAFREPLR